MDVSLSELPEVLMPCTTQVGLFGFLEAALTLPVFHQVCVAGVALRVSFSVCIVAFRYTITSLFCLLRNPPFDT